MLFPKWRSAIAVVAIVTQLGIVRSKAGTEANRAHCEGIAGRSVCTDPVSKLPVEVSAHIQEMTDLCRQVKGDPVSPPTIENGSLGVGSEFWAFDEGSFQCRGAETLYSGSHGSNIAVYVASSGGRAKQAVMQGGYGMSVDRTGVYPKIWITVGGALCGQRGDPSTAELKFCHRALRWNADTLKLAFAPLSEARSFHQPERQAGGVREEETLASAKQSANVVGPHSYQPAVHNGSTMVLSEWKDGTVEIVYDVPRHGLSAKKGTLLFRGIKDGARYSGTAYTFKVGCPPAAYPVAGVKDGKREIIVLNGVAPRRMGRSCEILEGARGLASAKLVFDIHIDGDE